jgi:ornithine cyclodeaminase/alanine dehydrogenase-like protein (mu-crystallin family)
MTLHISDNEVRRVFKMPEAYAALHEALSIAAEGKVIEPARLMVQFPGGWLSLQPGALPTKGYYGYKAYGGTKSKGVRYVVYLYDLNSGDLLAVIDADSLTVVRTGALSGVGTKYLARDDAKTLGLIGSGLQAGSLAEAVAHVRKLQRVKIYSRSKENRDGFAKMLHRSLGVEAVGVDEPSKAVKGCDIVGLATSKMDATPIVSGDWFEAGVHINAIGAVGRGRNEIDNRTFERSSLVVVDALEDCVAGAQELIDALKVGAVKREDIVELSQIVIGRKPGRTSAQQITLLKSQGSGVQDVASAAKIYEVALKKGIGTDVGNLAPAMRIPAKA